MCKLNSYANHYYPTNAITIELHGNHVANYNTLYLWCALVQYSATGMYGILLVALGESYQQAPMVCMGTRLIFVYNYTPIAVTVNNIIIMTTYCFNLAIKTSCYYSGINSYKDTSQLARIHA